MNNLAIRIMVKKFFLIVCLMQLSYATVEAKCFSLDFLEEQEVIFCYNSSISQMLDAITDCGQLEPLLNLMDQNQQLRELDSLFLLLKERYTLNDFETIYTAFFIAKKISELEALHSYKLLYFYLLHSLGFDVLLLKDKNEVPYVYGRFSSPISGSCIFGTYCSLEIDSNYAPQPDNAYICKLEVKSKQKAINIHPAEWKEAIVVTKNFKKENKNIFLNYKVPVFETVFFEYLPEFRTLSKYIYMSEVNKIELESKLGDYFLDKTTVEQLLFFLDFVRQLPYGEAERDICLFPDQTLTYEISDCEDRVLLMATLIKEFTSIKSAYFLDYSEPEPHAALAVELTDELKNQLPLSIPILEIYGYDAILLEPTGLNFEIGYTYEMFKNSSYEIYPLFMKGR